MDGLGPHYTSFSTRASVSTPHPSVGYRNRSSASQVSAYRPVASIPCPSRQTRAHSTILGRRSRANSSIWGSDGHQVLCAVSEARGVSPAVGLAFINTTTNEAVLSQICDSQFYVKAVHKIRLHEPSTILMVNTGFPPNPISSLLSILQEELPATTIEPLDRKYWSEIAGLEFIQALAFREDLDAIMVAIQGNYYATCSFAAVSHPRTELFALA